MKQADIDRGNRPGVSSAEAQEDQRLRQELKELTRANEMAESRGVAAARAANFSDGVI